MRVQKSRQLAVWVAALSVVATLGRVSAAEPAGWWKDLEIGTRSTWVYLTDHQRDINATTAAMGSFYGSIDQLDAVQNYWPLKPFIDYKLCPYGGIELAWDSLTARTITRGDGHTDGDLSIMGPMVSVFVRYPNTTGLTPYAGVGVAYYRVDFDEDADWHVPPGRSEIQTMDFDHTYGVFGYGGLIWKFADNWSADLYLRYTKVDAEGIHWQGPDGDSYGGSPSFPLSHIATGLGVRYSF
ncbi:MAG: porin family protein [Verrucomicrobia bacterium]|nr:MAG: porin family protein [Verrucomicrobiota bacterium]